MNQFKPRRVSDVPPTFHLANTDVPELTEQEEEGRYSLMEEIRRGKRLKDAKHLMKDSSGPAVDGNQRTKFPAPDNKKFPLPRGNLPLKQLTSSSSTVPSKAGDNDDTRDKQQSQQRQDSSSSINDEQKRPVSAAQRRSFCSEVRRLSAGSPSFRPSRQSAVNYDHRSSLPNDTTELRENEYPNEEIDRGDPHPDSFQDGKPSRRYSQRESQRNEEPRRHEYETDQQRYYKDKAHQGPYDQSVIPDQGGPTHHRRPQAEYRHENDKYPQRYYQRNDRYEDSWPAKHQQRQSLTGNRIREDVTKHQQRNSKSGHKHGEVSPMSHRRVSQSLQQRNNEQHRHKHRKSSSPHPTNFPRGHQYRVSQSPRRSHSPQIFYPPPEPLTDIRHQRRRSSGVSPHHHRRSHHDHQRSKSPRKSLTAHGNNMACATTRCKINRATQQRSSVSHPRRSSSPTARHR